MSDFSSPYDNAKQDHVLLAAEKKQRTFFNAVEMALSIGDSQKQADHPIDIQEFYRLLVDHINQTIPFNAGALCIVDQETSDIRLDACVPVKSTNEIEKHLAFLIENGYIAWALRENRGIMVYSKDGRVSIMLHAMNTFSRIRGIFIGLLPVKSKRLPDASLQALTLMLRNAANTLESLEYMDLYKRQNAELQTRVDEKVDQLRKRYLQRFNGQKLDAISALAGGVAHKYNNALSALIGNTDLIRLAISDGKEIDKYLDSIDALAHNMADLTLKLLAYARGGKYKPQSISVDELVTKALTGLKKLPEGITAPAIKSHFEECYVHVDLTQMQLALSAIFANAVEAIEPGGHIDICWEKLPGAAISQEHDFEDKTGAYVALEIRDDGRGMDEITKQRIFEPFFTTKFHGRGLSMAAVYGIVKNHKGDIIVESELGQGTTVRIYLPETNK